MAKRPSNDSDKTEELYLGLTAAEFKANQIRETKQKEQEYLAGLSPGERTHLTNLYQKQKEFFVKRNFNIYPIEDHVLSNENHGGCNFNDSIYESLEKRARSKYHWFSPGRNEYNKPISTFVVFNQKNLEYFYGENYTEITYGAFKCTPKYIFISPMQSSMIGFDYLYEYDNGFFKTRPILKFEKKYSYIGDYLDHKDVLFVPIDFNAASKCIPSKSLLHMKIHDRQYTINILRDFGYIGKADKFVYADNYMTLRFGTQSVDQDPFYKYSRASTCLELVFSFKNYSVKIEYLQVSPTYYVTNYIGGKREYEIDNNWVNYHCAQPKKAELATDCTSKWFPQTLAPDEKVDKLMKRQKLDFNGKTWLEITRKISKLFGNVFYMTLQDMMLVPWTSTSTTTSDDFQYLIMSVFQISLNGKTKYEEYLPRLSPLSLHPEVYRFMCKNYFGTKQFGDMSSKFKITYREIAANGIEFNDEDPLQSNIRELRPGTSYINKFYMLVAENPSNALNVIKKYHAKDNFYNDALLSKSFYNYKNEEIITSKICSYFMWASMKDISKEGITNRKKRIDVDDDSKDSLLTVGELKSLHKNIYIFNEKFNTSGYYATTSAAILLKEWDTFTPINQEFITSLPKKPIANIKIQEFEWTRC